MTMVAISWLQQVGSSIKMIAKRGNGDGNFDDDDNLRQWRGILDS